MKTIFITICLLFIFSKSMISQDRVEIFGHRGCRGILPENTILGFNKALELGADGIEWDVIVNKDNQLIISHEPYPDASYCLDSSGNEITKKTEKEVNFHELSTAEIQSFDCGSKGNSKFPDQEKIKSIKPTVQDAFREINLSSKTILFEIKSETKDYGISQPYPKEYAEIIVKEISSFASKEQIIFMSFDAEILNELHQSLPNFRFVYLTYLPLKSINSFVDEVKFKPYALGMYHHTIKKRDVKKANENGIKIFAWTVNEVKQYEKLVRYGVSGIITDYPNKIKITQ